MPAPARGLGRGLQSLIPAQTIQERSLEPFMVHISKIRANPLQPRQYFKEEALQELADSIRVQGLIQPLVVTPLQGPFANGEEYELIAGERRWRASKIAGLTQVPIVVKKVNSQEQLQIALIENIQREDLNPIEEAKAYKRLIEEFKLTQEELSHIVGKGRVVIANTLRLLNLPETLQAAVADGTISAGHARNLVSIGDQDLQKEAAEKILREHLTVRDVEKMVAEWKGAESGNKTRSAEKKDAEMRRLEETLQQILGTKVEIRVRGRGENIKGSINIAYFSLADLERLSDILNRNK